MQSVRSRLCVLAALLGGAVLSTSVSIAQSPSTGPSARLVPAPPVVIPALTDSNSPAVWGRTQGQERLFLFASEAGVTFRLEGPEVSQLAGRGHVGIANHPGHGTWIEAIIADVDGTWYGYYHHEAPADVCNDPQRTIPRIGAIRSRDFGATWENLGFVLEAPRGSHTCASLNGYFLGGVGDFSVILDQDHRYLYFFFSQYANRESAQGVSAARMAWADRNAPEGRLSVWLRSQTWLPVRSLSRTDGVRYAYPAGGPIFRVLESWHAAATVDAFWGPSVHWNTHLQQYVMLLNRAADSSWTQEGVYVAFTPQLADPATWTTPTRLIAGGAWYPQVVGLEAGTGTDKHAGEQARFFLGGASDSYIQFSR